MYSPLAFWMGGAGSGSAPAPTSGGIRSLLAPWLGGAGMVDAAPPANDGGYRSLLAPWIGGASGTPGAIEPPIPTPTTRPLQGGKPTRWYHDPGGHKEVEREELERERIDREEIARKQKLNKLIRKSLGIEDTEPKTVRVPDKAIYYDDLEMLLLFGI